MYTYTQVEGNSYFDVVAGQDVFSQTPVLLIVVGTFVLLLGIVGIVGSIFASTVAGRIILGLVNATYIDLAINVYIIFRSLVSINIFLFSTVLYWHCW